MFSSFRRVMHVSFFFYFFFFDKFFKSVAEFEEDVYPQERPSAINEYAFILVLCTPVGYFDSIIRLITNRISPTTIPKVKVL